MSDQHGRAPWQVVVAGAVLLALGIGILAWRYDVHRVMSPSMSPTVQQGDVGVFAPVEPDDVSYGDVVRFTPEWSEAQGFDPLLFRVIGVGGDRIECCAADGRLIVNGEALAESYAVIADGVQFTAFEVAVPPEHIFVAGDVRGVSNDSRTHLDINDGSIPATSVEGRLVGVAWPVWHWRVPDATRRFFDRDPQSEHPLPGGYLLSLPLMTIGAGCIVVGLMGLVQQLKRAHERRRERRVARA